MFQFWTAERILFRTRTLASLTQNSNSRVFRNLQIHAGGHAPALSASRRSWMSLSVRFPITSLYRVEVSGWDKSQTFFVEKSELEWNEESGKHVTLSSAVPDGSVVFLRLIQPLSADSSQAVPYETEFVSITPGGQNQFRLHPVSPRAADRGSVN